MLELAAKSLLAYLLGAFLGSLIVGWLRGGVDIRKLGSGNAGGTNALRTQGIFFALGVIAIDVGKGWIATRFLPQAVLPGVPIDPALDRTWLTAACAVAVVLGHIYPVWYEFRGGKGGATLVGATLGVEPKLLLPALAVWLVVAMLTGFVGFSTICAAVALAVAAAWLLDPPSTPFTALYVATALLIGYAHRDNVRRMLAGTESRARRLWLFGR
ncbi:MAG TPA: glycerol-3-phosphate 1-O-acyltransferase PlsY [Steroidobacteraceae bacterium]|nr:glycerol-3-phosphate 1-O-acyltransferase PlsY [Steroidobacteraceae bacterium]